MYIYICIYIYIYIYMHVYIYMQGGGPEGPSLGRAAGGVAACAGAIRCVFSCVSCVGGGRLHVVGDHLPRDIGETIFTTHTTD